MSDWQKTKAQLIAELAALRAEVASLKQAAAIVPVGDTAAKVVGAAPVVLVIEDDPNLNRCICRVLRSGYQTLAAYDGREGWEQAISHQPDLILCDLSLPEVNGDELIQWIRADATLCETPILLISSSDADFLRGQLAQLGAQDFLVKPFSLEALQIRVRNLLATRQEKAVLEQRVEERTAHLRCANQQLQREIGDRQRAEQDLTLTRERFRQAILDAPLPVLIHAEDGEVLQANHAWTELSGYTTAEISSIAAWTALAYGDSAAAVQARVAHLFNVNGRVSEGEYDLTTRKGERLTWNFHSAPLADLPDGRRVRITMALDVTERHRAERALQASELWLRLALEGANLGMWDRDLRSDRIEANDRCKAMLGLAPTQELTAAWLLQVGNPVELARASQRVTAAIAQRTGCDLEYQIRGADGNVRWIAVKGRAFYNAAGEPIRMAGITLDITDRKREEADRRWAEQALRASEQKFRAIFNHTFELMGLVSLEGRVLEINQAALDSIATQRLEIVGKLFWDTPWWTHSPPTQQQLKRAIAHAAQGEFVRYEVNFPTGNGRSMTTDFSLKPMFDDAGQILMLIAEGRDITDRKQVEQALKQAKMHLEVRVNDRTAELREANARLLRELIERQQIEAALRQSEAKFRSVCECSPMGILMTDIHGNIIYTNPRCQEICGYTAAEAMGSGWIQFVHPDDVARILTQWSPATAKHEIYGEVRYIHKDSTVRYGRLQTAPIFAADGEISGYVGTVEDVTEGRAIERMKSEFISIVSHELRTPLTSIRGSLGLLATGIYDDRPSKARRMIEIAVTDTDRLVRLVNDILDLERLESGEVSLVREACAVAPLLERALEAMQPLAQPAQITLEIVPPTTALPVWANPDALLQTLTNLISNAIKFSPPHATIWLTATLQSDPEPPASPPPAPASPANVCFAVQDQGRGIPPDKLNTIFERFQQVDASDARRKGGTGLGLTICQSIVRQHGGQIWAESQLGSGSIFYFTVPVALPLGTIDEPLAPHEATHVR